MVFVGMWDDNTSIEPNEHSFCSFSIKVPSVAVKRKDNLPNAWLHCFHSLYCMAGKVFALSPPEIVD